MYLYRFYGCIVVMVGHLNFTGDKLKTNIQMSFQKDFLNSQLQGQLGKSGWNIAIPFLFWPNVMVGQNKIIF